MPETVNGPEGGLEWELINWAVHESNVVRLRQRIFTATREGDWPKVRNLQRLMLRSWSNTLVSVRQVTQRNSGRATAGVDGFVALDGPARMGVAVQAHQTIRSWEPQPVRRVYIPKANGKQRPLGIPVIMDRVHQARVKNALEPEWEARFEPRSYGFRPGRACQDAAGVLFITLKGKAKRVWILDADLTAAFDKIDHAYLMDQIGSFPARDMIAGWLRAGVFEAGKGFAPTEEGTPQGGLVSPVLLNVALNGLEGAAGVSYRSGKEAGKVRPGSPVMVRYADDFVVCCHSRQAAERVREQLTGWLAERGLSFNQDKTRIVHLTQGFDFLGWTFRRYPSGKLLIKPSKKAVSNHRRKLAAEMRKLRGSNAITVIGKLNPVIRGWTTYHRGMVSSEIFSALGNYTWKLTWKWGRSSHQNKSGKWVKDRYYGRYHPHRADRWVFGDRETGAYLLNHAWTQVQRHVTVKGTASPDDRDLARYWHYRRHAGALPLDGTAWRLLRGQDMCCPLCGERLLDPDHLPGTAEAWQDWWFRVTYRGGPRAASAPGQQQGTRRATTSLVHTSCRQAENNRQRRGSPALQPATP